MKSIRKKAQTATEYLIILAVVIIIALIVVGVLGGIPGIGGGASTAAQSAFWQTATIGIESMAVRPSSGEAKPDVVVLKNNLPNSATISGLWIATTTQSRDDPSAINLVANSSLFVGNRTTLAAGQTTTITNISIHDCSPGETVTLYAKIEYEDLATGAKFNYTAQNNEYQTICASG